MEHGKTCPLLHAECIRDRCAWWIEIWGTPVGGGQPVLDKDCAINWQVLMQREQLIEQERLAAGVDKASNASVSVADALDRVRFAAAGPAIAAGAVEVLPARVLPSLTQVE
jgi:hypothetical protein